jgi:hypothetical protein
LLPLGHRLSLSGAGCGCSLSAYCPGDIIDPGRIRPSDSYPAVTVQACHFHEPCPVRQRNLEQQSGRCWGSCEAAPLSQRIPFPIFGSRDATHVQVCVPALRGRYFPYLGNSVHGVRSCSGYLSWRVLVPSSGSLDVPDGLSLPWEVYLTLNASMRTARI